MFLLLLLFFYERIGKPKQLIIGLFKVDTTWQALAKSLIKLLDQYCLKKKIIAYVKYENSNLNAMINAFKFVVKCCETVGLEENFQGIALTMLSLRLVSMPQQKIKCAKIWRKYPLLLPS